MGASAQGRKMNMRTADLTSKMSEYLSRRVPPKGIASDEMLKVDQMNEYLRILRRFSPEGEKFLDWWREFSDRLSDESDTWAWPAPKDVAKAAKAAGAVVGKAGAEWKPDSVQINLARLNAGQPIGEDWLWGSGALRLEAAGASRHTLRERRVQLANDMAQLYPADQVKAKLADLKARHEAAIEYRDAFQAGQISRDIRIPRKSAFLAGELEALVE